MSKPVYKVLIFSKRRPGMSLEEFRDYYENKHVVVCAPYMGGVRKYTRRYIQPLPNSVTNVNEEMEFDAITELTFDDQETVDQVLKYAAKGKLPPEVIADEERVFDRTKIRFATFVECETPPAAPKS